MSFDASSLRYRAAAARFAAFFEELGEIFVEREDVLAQLQLALLSREHSLLTGPPGTAKSQLASATFGRILDEETGLPSLFSRQLTESTVQTDLVGPIDFKTLMSTGRTEHFTDEGMLGAVHAFLDEVFDGRDNLLRGALNVLQERELKQGTRVTRGRVECALMTSNRYISDVLEGSRETLLAFVDRIAFVGFVPRGFAEADNLAAVLRRQLGSDELRLPSAPLTIQDLDTLQDAVDATEVPDAICDSLAMLLEMLDDELNAAVRADPSFVPTRYLSTRTAVRSGKVLRAACVLDKVRNDYLRPLKVRPGDLPMLRLHLLLSGPTPEQAAKLVERESDSHERRQLGILRTERELFARCLTKLEAAPPAKKKRKAAAKVEARTPQVNVAAELEEQVQRAFGSGSSTDVLDALQAAAPLARGAGTEAAQAQRLMREAMGRLGAQVVDASLAPATSAGGSLRSDVDRMVTLAGTLDSGPVEARPLARWLRGRALEIVDGSLAREAGANAGELAVAAGLAAPRAGNPAERRLEALEDLAALREKLRVAGASVPAGEGWARAVAIAEDEVALVCDEELRDAVAAALSRASADQIHFLLDTLGPTFARFDALAKRIDGLGGPPSKLKARVVGPRLGGLVGAVVERLDARDRVDFSERVGSLLRMLEQAGLGAAISPAQWLGWVARALLRDVATAEPQPSRDYEGYRRLREAEPRVAGAYALAELATRVAPPTAGGEVGMSSLALRLAAIDSAARDELVRRDLARIGRALEHLDAWWASLKDGGPHTDPAARLEALVRSRFYDVVLDEEAPARFALEARLLGELFPGATDAAAALSARAETLAQRAHAVAQDLLRRRADQAWRETLAAGLPPGSDGQA